MGRPGDVHYPTIFQVAPGDCDLPIHVAVNTLTELTGEPAWGGANTKWGTAEWRAEELWVDVAPDVNGITVERSDTEAAHLQVQLRNSSLRYSQAELEFPIGGLIAVWLDPPSMLRAEPRVLTPAFKSSLGSGVDTLSGNVVGIVTTAAIAVGDLVVVRVATDNLSATTPTFACTDSAGNVYTVLQQLAGNATPALGVAGALIASKATVAMAAGGNIVVTLSGSVVAKAAYAQSFTNCTTATRSTPVGSVTATGAVGPVTSGTVAAGDLVLGWTALETNATAITGDADTLNGTWSTIVNVVNAAGGTGNTRVQVGGQHKIVTAAGAQTWGTSAATADCVGGVVVLQAAPDVIIIPPDPPDPATIPIGEWKFYGRITSWVEDYPTTPDRDVQRSQASVSIEAFDSIFLLNQHVDGITYQLGAEGERTPSRIGTLASTASFERHLKLDQSTMPHHNTLGVAPLWESMQVAAESDGGDVFIDNDGALMYLDRNSLIQGRRDHTQPFCTFSDTCAPGTYAFSEGLPRTSDTLIRNDVVLTNVYDVQARALDQGSINQKGRRLMALDDQTWADAAMAGMLANDLLDRSVLATYFLDPIVVARGPVPWLRIGDRVRYQRTLPSGTRIDADFLVTALAWSYDPAGEFLAVTTSPVTAFNAYTRWGEAIWGNPTAVWVP